MLQGEALGVHLFAATGGEHRDDALAVLADLWDRCGTTLAMTDPVPRTGVATEPADPQSWLPGRNVGAFAVPPKGLLAARTRPGPGLRQAALRREHDALCLSVMLAPADAEGLSWADLDRQWSELMQSAGATAELPGLLGITRLYLARLAAPTARPTGAPATGPSAEPHGPLATAVGAAVPAAPAGPATVAGPATSAGPEPGLDSWCYAGVVVPQGFAVWETTPVPDARTERRLVVIAAHDRDPELTAWTWTTRARQLPPLATYLLHAAKLRYQLRVWAAAGGIGPLRAHTDAAIAELLDKTAAAQHGPARQAELLTASHVLVDLQARERGLVDRSTRSREMSRTVEIAAANLTALSGDPALGGPFADDQALAGWFTQRLDDEATYLESALHRAERVTTLADQLLQRSLQRRQEAINLGLTGAVGAILMSLAAIQSLQYSVPLPGPVKPAVVAALGALALLASLLVLRVVAPQRRWSLILVRFGVAIVGAALAWVAVAALAGGDVPAGWTWVCAVTGALAAAAAAVALGRWRR